MTAEAFLSNAQRRLPAFAPEYSEWIDEVERGGDPLVAAEAIAFEMMAWARDVLWEPDWDLVFDILDLWAEVLDTTPAEDHLAIIVTGMVAHLDVPTKRYGSAALTRPAPGFAQQLREAPALVSATRHLWRAPSSTSPPNDQ